MSTAYVLANPFPLTGNQIVDVTTNGYKWYFPMGTPRILNWSVSSSRWTHPELQSTETQADFARAFGNIAELINVQFNSLGYISGSNGLTGYESAYLSGSDLNITYAYNGTSSSGVTVSDGKFTSNYETAFCYFPDLDYNINYQGAAGDTFLNYNNSFLANATFESGTSSFALLLHEILHGLGLKHPHDSGGSGRPTYTSLDMKFADRQWISVMSYDQYENGGDGAYSGSQPIGPMLLDAIALQYLYGESTFNSGDTKYNIAGYLGNYYNCQWDASGIDTLDGTNLSYGMYLELGTGSVSNGYNIHHIGFITSVFDKIYLDATGYNPTKWTWLWGEYENVNGTPYFDYIVGNDLDNVINGGSGDDFLYGKAGNDTFDWEVTLRGGNDHFEGGIGNDTYVIDSFYDVIVENPNEGVDTVYVGYSFSLVNTYLENIRTFSNQIIGLTFTGNSWGNEISGGQGGDALFGNEGNDSLNGGVGNDTLDGGTGIDTVVLSGTLSNYYITYNRALGTATITDKRTSGDGIDSLKSIEKLQFSDKTFDLLNPARTSTPTYGVTPSFLFDPAYYLLKNPELTNTVSLTTAFDNYIKTGAAAGKSPNVWFDPAYYSNRWSDLKPLNLDAATLFQHYNLYGVWEGRSAGNLFDKFDGTRYLKENPDVAGYVDAYVKDFLGSRTNGAIAHYIIYGANESRSAYDSTGKVIEQTIIIGTPT